MAIEKRDLQQVMTVGTYASDMCRTLVFWPRASRVRGPVHDCSIDPGAQKAMFFLDTRRQMTNDILGATPAESNPNIFCAQHDALAIQGWLEDVEAFTSAMKLHLFTEVANQVMEIGSDLNTPDVSSYVNDTTFAKSIAKRSLLSAWKGRASHTDKVCGLYKHIVNLGTLHVQFGFTKPIETLIKHQHQAANDAFRKGFRVTQIVSYVEVLCQAPGEEQRAEVEKFHNHPAKDVPEPLKQAMEELYLEGQQKQPRGRPKAKAK